MIWGLAICCLLLAAWVARLLLLLRRAAQPRPMLTQAGQPQGELFLKPVVVLRGDNDFDVVHDPGNGEQPQRIAFVAVEAVQWGLAANLKTGLAKLHLVIEQAEIWKPVEAQ